MIIKFIVSNFKSFKEKTEFNMIAGNYKKHDEHVYKSTIGLDLLRTTAIYGNNASGKSNFINALDKLQDIVLDGTLDSKEKIYISTFKLDEVSQNMPTVFEIEFLKNNKRYSYSITIKQSKILQEWLYIVTKNGGTETIFERTIIEGKTNLKIGESKKLDQKEKLRIEIYSEELRDNQPFILEGNNKKIESIKEAFDWFYSDLRFMKVGSKYSGLAHKFDSEKEVMEYAKQIINSINIGICDLSVDKMPIEDFFSESDAGQKKEIIEALNKENKDGVGIRFDRNEIDYNAYRGDNSKIFVSKLTTKHISRTKDFQFELKDESDGTRRILNLLPLIIKAIIQNGIIVVDEIESSIHPVIIKELLKLYLDAGNTFGGQLIFTTHECHLLDLDLLRQDEIWFVEKNECGESVVYSLSDFRPRFDKDIRKGYIDGQFSKIPFLTHPTNLNWHELKTNPK
jgi:uncharacterized protein